MPLIAAVQVTKLAGLASPVPVMVTMTVTDADGGVATDIASPEIRRRDPDGRLATLSAVRTAAGTYVAGSQLAPIVLTRPFGTWRFEGRSSDITELVMQAVDEITIYDNGFPAGTAPALQSGSQPAKVTSHRVTQAEINAGTPVQVALPFIPSAAIATVSGGADVSHLTSCDGTHAYVLLAMSDGVNPSLFSDGDVVVITALE